MTLLFLTWQANYNYKIYECLTPNGEILPGETAKVEWKFSPLEAKMYTVGTDVLLTLVYVYEYIYVTPAEQMCDKSENKVCTFLTYLERGGIVLYSNSKIITLI